MKVLVTGGAGYVGSVLVPLILNRGYEVRVLDNGMFGTDHINPEAEFVQGNVLEFNEKWLENVDVVVHLAGFSNDPMAAFSPEMNYVLNAGGAATVAHKTKEAGINRFVFASTCSVYGLNDVEVIDESGSTKPNFPYAISKLMAERALECMSDDDFHPIMLRKGTVVGWSSRMRFDLVTNAMLKDAVTTGTVNVHNASLWRPLIDVHDAANAYLRAIDAGDEVTGIFNVATDNYTIGRLADIVQEEAAAAGIESKVNVLNIPDVRSYRVTSDKARATLDFSPEIDMRETVRRIVQMIKQGAVTDFTDSKYYNVLKMKEFLGQSS